ncbi:MAG: GNAT family N-acetyltransferase [Leptolinea sp.]|jgi:RimJ/RimL family protein N-acetyltransferase|nr:GNAT family N-acetyltransferase [Leptolinea sp.]
MFEHELMAGKNVHLTEIDPETDAMVEAAWTQDPVYRLLMEYDKPRGWTADELKKYYEAHLKDSDEHRNEFHFGVRANTDNRLVGIFTIPGVEWSNRSMKFHIGFGHVNDLQNWGTEAFRLGLNYIFGELNIYLAAMHVPQFCREMVEVVEEEGMQLTARRREAVFYNGRYWAELVFCIQHPIWMARRTGVAE